MATVRDAQRGDKFRFSKNRSLCSDFNAYHVLAFSRQMPPHRLAFHPTRALVLTGLRLSTGAVKALAAYDEQGNHEEKFAARPYKRFCCTLALAEDGAQAWAGGKGKVIQCISIPLRALCFE